jgi:hypothetical protein
MVGGGASKSLQILVGKPLRKCFLGRKESGWVENIKLDLRF